MNMNLFERVFFNGLSFGFITYFPTIALTIPCPPDVPGSQAARTVSDEAKRSSINNGLPDKSTLIKGMFLSCSLIVLRTSESYFDN